MEENIPKKDLIEMRGGVRTDAPFILSTWLNGLYYGNDWIREIEKNIFMKVYHDVIERKLYQPGVLVKVACLKEEHDVILGYSVYEGQILHYVFVKPVWRRIGLARDLVPDDITVTSHLTGVGRSIKPERVSFNPFLIIGSNV